MVVQNASALDRKRTCPEYSRKLSRRLDYVPDLTSQRANPANGVIADRCGAANRPTPRDNQADEINLEEQLGQAIGDIRQAIGAGNWGHPRSASPCHRSGWVT
jgi:hypothetical protein